VGEIRKIREGGKSEWWSVASAGGRRVPRELQTRWGWKEKPKAMRPGEKRISKEKVRKPFT